GQDIILGKLYGRAVRGWLLAGAVASAGGRQTRAQWALRYRGRRHGSVALDDVEHLFVRRRQAELDGFVVLVDNRRMAGWQVVEVDRAQDFLVVCVDHSHLTFDDITPMWGGTARNLMADSMSGDAGNDRRRWLPANRRSYRTVFPK